MSIVQRIDKVTLIPESHRRTICPAPRSVKIELTSRCDLRCLRGDTLIDTIYGRIPISEIAQKYDTIPVYTYKDGEVFISDAINIRKTGFNEKLVRVLFDDGSHIDCTPDHKFLQFKSLGNEPGTEEWATEAQDLNPGSRVRAYRENVIGGGYLNIALGREFRKKRSRIVMEYVLKRKLSKSEMIHHKDHNVLNDLPSNLEYTSSAKEHFSHHPEISERMRKNNPVKNMTQEWRDKLTQSLRGQKRSLEQRLHYRESKLGTKNPNYINGEYSGIKSRVLEEVNHKVVSVTNLNEIEEVYCMEVPETGWFFANKVLVKNCKFCATAQNLRPKGDMDMALYRKIVRDMKDSGVKEIGVFYLGESVLYPYLAEAISYAKTIGIEYVFLTTNGRMLATQTCYDIFEAGLDSLKFSFNSYDAQQYRDVTGVDGFNRVIANIQNAREIRDEVEKNTGKRCGFYASSIKFDNEQQVKMEEAANEYVLPFVDEHYWLPLYNQAGFTKDAMGKKSVAGNIGRIGALRESLPCWALFCESHVTFDGKMTGCCFDHNDSFTFGDLNEMSFMDAWNSESAQKLREANLKKDVRGTACEKCIAYGG